MGRNFNAAELVCAADILTNHYRSGGVKKILLSDLMRCPKTWHTLIPLGELRGGELIIEDSLVETLKDCPEPIPIQEWNTSIKQSPLPAHKPEPILPEAWPIWAQPMKLLAKDGDKGLGDIIARVVGTIGGDAYKAWHLKTFGHPCGCSERQESLNQKYPLTTATK